MALYDKVAPAKKEAFGHDQHGLLLHPHAVADDQSVVFVRERADVDEQSGARARKHADDDQPNCLFSRKLTILRCAEHGACAEA